MSDCSKYIRQREAFTTDVPKAPECNPPVVHSVPVPATLILILIGAVAYRWVMRRG